MEQRAVHRAARVGSVIKVTDLGALPRIGGGSARLDVWIEDDRGTFLARSSLSGEDYVIRK